MHRSLRVPEVFQLILYHIYDPKQAHSYRQLDEIRPGDKEQWRIAAVNALARTCKSFCNPSLDMLWYHQTGLKPLIKCLPDSILTCQIRDFGPEYLSLRRDLVPEDFERVELYARRIRILGAATWDGLVSRHSEEESVHPMVFPAFISRRSIWGLGHLFPNLTCLNVGIHEFGGLAWLPRLVIGPKLESVTIVSTREALAFQDYTVHWGNVFASLSSALPTVRSFSLTIHTKYLSFEDSDIHILPAPEVESALNILRTMQAPTVLDILSFPLDVNTLEHITTLRTIGVLRICVTEISSHDNLSETAADLPNMFELAVLAKEPQFCSTLVRRLGPKCLSTLRVIRADGAPEIWNMDWFIESLNTARFLATLIELEISTPVYEDSPNPQVAPITSETINRLSIFKRLRSIRLYLNGQVALNPQCFQSITSLWPTLTVLDLRSRTKLEDVNPQLNLKDLLSVTAKLPSLKEVRLRVDARGEIVYATMPFQPSGVVSQDLNTLDVCTSPISELHGTLVATMLGAAFPNLRSLHYGWIYDNKEGEPMESELSLAERRCLSEWDTVEATLRSFMHQGID